MEKVKDSPVVFHCLVVKDVYKWTKFVEKNGGELRCGHRLGFFHRLLVIESFVICLNSRFEFQVILFGRGVIHLKLPPFSVEAFRHRSKEAMSHWVYAKRSRQPQVVFSSGNEKLACLGLDCEIGTSYGTIFSGSLRVSLPAKTCATNYCLL